MKALPSIAFNEFTGSAGDVTARSIGGRTLLNHKAYQSHKKTPSQASSRNSLSKISRAYKQLTDSQMAAWAVLAEHMKGISTFGDAASLTPHNAFVRINTNRDLVGMSMLSDAPEYTSDVPEPDYEDFWVTPEKLIFVGMEQPKSSYRLVLRMGTAQSNGVTSGWGNLVIISPDLVPDWGDVDALQLYTERLGMTPVLGQKYFIEMYWMDSDNGFVSETVRVSTVCSEYSHVKHEEYAPALKIESDSFKPTEQVDSIEVNLSVGSGFMALNMEGAGESGVAAMTAEFETVPEGVTSGTSYMFAYCADDETRKFQDGEVGIYVSGDSGNVHFYHREGYGKKPYTVLGQGIIF